ncbi:MAG: hypothetical protein NZ959_11805 [Armatimonadetes bacterium]|nr:hypothetical protein [Armatimonadota bacterium]MDW8122668.1 hypothetical protein [Armatimonadota bacterium]
MGDGFVVDDLAGDGLARNAQKDFLDMGVGRRVRILPLCVRTTDRLIRTGR